MSTYSDIVSDIQGKFQAIPNIGIVHPYERQSVDVANFISLFAQDAGNGQKKILGWEITRGAVSEKRSGTFQGFNRFVVRGYMGIQDEQATGTTFQLLVDAIRAKFREAAPANPTATFLYLDEQTDNSPVQVPVISDRMFGTYLCHYAEIHICVQDRSTP